METKTLEAHGRRLAYRHRPRGPGGAAFVWLSGFKSDMSGGKATALEAWTGEAGHGWLGFDYSGHGQSSGRFEDGTISAWRDDALAALDALTDGPQILIGSSMGGWLALLCALARPDRIAGLVLIAPAPDFTEKLMWPEFSPAQQAEIMEQGVLLRPSDYGDPYPITRALIEDGRRWSILDQPIEIAAPVRILQGMQDPDVPWRHAFRLVETIRSGNVLFTLVKDGDHRLSREEDIARLVGVCRDLATETA